MIASLLAQSSDWVSPTIDWHAIAPELVLAVGINLILLLHSMIMSFGGIPLLYYGDEIGTLNGKMATLSSNVGSGIKPSSLTFTIK